MGQFKDITNQQFGTLIVNEYLGKSKWKCSCKICGNEVIAKTNSLKNLIKKQKNGCKHAKQINLGDKFGYLTVIDFAEDYIKPKSGRHEKQWLCKCLCGREKVVLQDNLKSLKSTSCGKCSNRISIPEKAIVFYLSNYFNDIKENYHPEFLKGKEIDIYLPSLRVGIEYDGERWHKDINKDIDKNNSCRINGIELIRVREPNCPKSDLFNYSIVTPKPTTNGAHMTEPIKEIINILNKSFNTNILCDVDCLRDNANICKNLISTTNNNSLSAMFPDIAEEWDYKKNSPLLPNEVAAHSGRKAWWICPKGHSYSSVIASRTSPDRCGCPICSNVGNAIYKNGVYIGENSLLKIRPDIAKEFNTIKNGISPNEIPVASNKKMWWKCNKCGFEWQAKVNNRTSSLHTGCPNCSKIENKSGKNRVVNFINKNGSLLDNYPDLCKQWDYERNDSLPSDFTSGSSTKVWWICQNGHSYKASISKRTALKPTSCPYCSKPNLNKKIAQYDMSGNLLKIWPNAREAASFLNIKTDYIYRCCDGKRNKSCGYIWKFVD